MKRTIIASILGIAASLSIASKTQAQGFVYFANYNGGGTFDAVTYASGPNAGQNVGSEFSANLLYSFGANLGTTYSDLNLGTSVPFFGSDGGSPLTDGAGLFGGLTLQETIPGYSSGAVDFIVQVYNGATYATSSWVGQSSVVTLSVLATAANQLPTGGLLGDNANATSPLSAFTVSPVPEPTSLALAGLGGLASLMAFRRKRA